MWMEGYERENREEQDKKGVEEKSSAVAEESEDELRKQKAQTASGSRSR